jgi:hypothetical protein
MPSSLQDGQEIWVRCSTSFCGNSGFVIFTVHLQMNGQDGSAAAGASCTAAPGWLAGVEPSARSGGHFPRGLHLWKTGILTEVLAGVSEVGCGMAMKRRLLGMSARSRGPWGAPPASVLLPAVATVSSLPQRPVGQGLGVVKCCGGE